MFGGGEIRQSLAASKQATVEHQGQDTKREWIGNSSRGVGGHRGGGTVAEKFSHGQCGLC